MESTKESVRETIIELLGEGAWQYACYNFDINKLIAKSTDEYELAEMIQDLIAQDLSNAGNT